MLYCLKCRKNTESKNPKVARSKNGRIMLLSKCAVCDSKKSKFIKQEEPNELLSSLRIKTPLSKIPLIGPLFVLIVLNKLIQDKMNDIVNKVLLAGSKLMPEIHLRQPGFTWSACRLFTKNKENSKI